MPSELAYPHMHRPLANVIEGDYRCLLLDPPWPERGGGQSKRGADAHYDILNVRGILEVIQMAPCWRPADSAHLWLWVTNNYLSAGMQVMQTLGFRYVTNMVWCKPSFGLGFYLRGQHEICLFGTRGDCMPPSRRDVPSVLHAPKGEHSAKPEKSFEVFEAISPGPRLEMFARRPRSKWTTWGNEIGPDTPVWSEIIAKE